MATTMVRNALPAYFDSPAESGLPSPTYSVTPARTETLVRTGQVSPSSPREPNWSFASDHMEVDLGPKDAWSLHFPTFGLHGTVEGFVSFNGEQRHVAHVTATLKGHLTTTSTDRGLVAAQSKHLLLSTTVSLYSHTAANNAPWGEKILFSLPIPHEVSQDGAITALPPSFAAYRPGISSEVNYVVKFDMVRKGFRRHECVIIPILYLPKSWPQQPAIDDIPLPRGSPLQNPTPIDERVRSIKLTPLWLKAPPRHDESWTPSVYFTLPFHLTFASGGSIPVMLSVLSPASPALAKLLAANIGIGLFKRRSLVTGPGRGCCVWEVPLATARLYEITSQIEGFAMFKGTVRAGTAGRDQSWRVPKVAEVQYVIRLLLQPPNNVTEHLPSFRHEEVVEITTDPFGSMQRELLTLGGRPMPALGFVPHGSFTAGRTASGASVGI